MSSVRAPSKLNNQHIRNRSIQVGLRWTLSVHRPEGLFYASLILTADREQRCASFYPIQPGATFSACCTPQTTAQRAPRVKSHCGETENGIPRECFGKRNNIEKNFTCSPFSPSPVLVQSLICISSQVILFTRGDKFLLCLNQIFHPFWYRYTPAAQSLLSYALKAIN